MTAALKFETVSGDMAALKLSLDTDGVVGTAGSSSLKHQPSAVTERQTMDVASMAFQTNSPDQHIERNKNKKKRSPAIGKIVSVFKTFR
jgi:hypothetical protein